MRTKSPLEAHRRRFVRNLTRAYQQASASARTDGERWYPEARRIVAEWSESYGLPRATVASVIAAISPQCEWSRNLIIADDVLAERAISVGGALHANITKARAIRARASDSLDVMLEYFPGGPKVNSFAVNLIGSDAMVTVDTHALQAAFNDVTLTLTLKWTPYRIVAECYALAAHRCHVAPATFQAVIWHAWKERYPKGVKNHLRRSAHA